MTARLPTITPTPAATPTPTRRAAPDVTNGRGTFTVAEGTATAGRGTAVAYRVEVEDGLPFEETSFAQTVDRVLGDDRGWTRQGYTLTRSGTAQLRVVLASPATTDRLCAPLQTRGEVSCRNGDVVAINAKRWALGAPSYASDLAAYRTYVVNHEFGHALGRPHQPCPTPGAPAPVMLQQTIGLDGCRPNPWP